MKTFKKTIFILVFTILAFACSHDDKETNGIADCETNNYGVLTVNFGSTDTKHGILITKVNTDNSRDKISNAGVSQDTVHLKPGTYNIEISSLNEQDLALESETLPSYSISKCDEKTTYVEF